jgi:hypothetical protein
MKKKSIKKPVKIVGDPYWDYHQVISYIENKYQIDTRDCAGKHTGNPDAEYQDFWHWICDRYDINNGSFFELDIADGLDYDGTYPWVKDILTKLLDEFGEPVMYCLAAW